MRWGIVVMVVAAPAIARADGPTLPKGRAAASLTLQTGLTRGQPGAPLSLAPDVWVGVSDTIQVGMVTSIQGRTGFWSGAVAGGGGSGVCLSGRRDDGDVGGCGDLAEDGGAEVLIAPRDASGAFQAATSAGYHVYESDPYTFQFKIGGRARLRLEHFTAGMAVSWFFGSQLSLSVPIDVGLHAGDRLVLAVQSGIQYRSDDRMVPMAFAAIWFLSPAWVLAGSFSFDRVAGFEGPGPFDRRSASLMVGTML